MRVAVVGTGYVGLVSGACFSEFGFDVTCIDKDGGKIERLTLGEIPIFEPGLDEIVGRNVAAGRLHFTTDLTNAVAGADAVFIAVGTPSRRGDGHADLSFVLAAAADIGRALTGYAVVVTKSTVPVGTGRKVADAIEDARAGWKAGVDFDVASNPEFLREGSAIEDFLRPDRVVIGTDDSAGQARTIMRALYRPLSLIETPMVFTTLETAELTKYAANSFLAAKITFINEIADLCEKVGADVQDVARGIGLDGRIGRKFLNAGPGYGGSCFPKDCLALVQTAREAGSPVSLVEQVVRINDGRKLRMARIIEQAAGGSVRNKTIAMLGLTFKPNTDDMREAPSLSVVPALQAAGATIRAFDPEGMREAEKLLPGIVFCSDAYQTLEGADLLVLMTEWNAFRALDMQRVKKALHSPVIVDLRNIYKPDQMAEAGFHYTSIGRPGKRPQPPPDFD